MSSPKRTRGLACTDMQSFMLPNGDQGVLVLGVFVLHGNDFLWAPWEVVVLDIPVVVLQAHGLPTGEAAALCFGVDFPSKFEVHILLSFSGSPRAFSFWNSSQLSSGSLRVLTF